MLVPLFWSPSTARNSRLGGMTAPFARAGMLKADMSGTAWSAMRELPPKPPERLVEPKPPPRELAPLRALEMVSLTFRAQLARLFQILSRPERIPSTMVFPV